MARWSYRGAPRSLILALKLQGARSAAAPLAVAVAQECRRAGVGATMVTWVPARAADRRRRGFDHAEVLARGVGSALGLPVVGALARRGQQADQAGLGRDERAANVGGAFVGSRLLDGPILLVDDLVTTGATAAACATALRASGASAVEVAVACRA